MNTLDKKNIILLQIYELTSTEYMHHVSLLLCISILPEQYFSEKMVDLRKYPKILY